MTAATTKTQVSEIQQKSKNSTPLKKHSATPRVNFGTIKEVIDLPDLIEMQKTSYNGFLQRDAAPKKRKPEGLEAALRDAFPLEFQSRPNQDGVATLSILEYLHYELLDPEYDMDECKRADHTYGCQLMVRLRMSIFDADPDTEQRKLVNTIEQPVYFGILPIMTPYGTFIINGADRVVVSQIHRSPGVFLSDDGGKTHASGKVLHSAKVIPYRGSWLDIEFDHKDVIHAKIDRKKKVPVTTLLKALGMEAEEILRTFYSTADYTLYKKRANTWKTEFKPDWHLGAALAEDLVNAKDGKTVAEAGKRFTKRTARELEAQGVKHVLVKQETLPGGYLAADLVDAKDGSIIGEAGDEITAEMLDQAVAAGLDKVSVLEIDHVKVGPYVRNSLQADKAEDRAQALTEIYRLMRPGDTPALDTAERMLHSIFFDPDRYDLSAVGRVKMNARLKLECDDSVRTLRREDIVAIVKALVELKDGRDKPDDIDNLANRRVRSAGELMENQCRIGLMRMARPVIEKMRMTEPENLTPQQVINARPVVAVIKEFFGSSQLSQYMDQTNPLSEITHKRRISALGPGGLTRERAGFEARDVHTTHYGRLCPIETPEGQNIGLINSLSTYASVNKYGFVETPFRKIKDGRVTDEVVYLSAMEEQGRCVAQADVRTEGGRIADDFVVCRLDGEVQPMPKERVELIDVTPKQVVSVAAALIPFLENDDANRALMGSNMQRQAVPLLRPDAPLVGTGMEGPAARDSGAAIMARRAGIVDQVDAKRIVVRVTEDLAADQMGIDIYPLKKYQRSNQNTCINQKPIVHKGDAVAAGDVIADGPCTERGELALGKNMLVAFMPWNGYNFEDSILLSERVVRDDVFTSVHLEEFVAVARDTKIGPEEITRDIPNAGEERLAKLDECGIVHVGAVVKGGDVLVGKVTPKGDAPITPEEKLLRAIFGEKASDVRDSSLRLDVGMTGTVVEVRTFNIAGVDKDERSVAIEREEIDEYQRYRADGMDILNQDIRNRMAEAMQGRKPTAAPDGFDKSKELTAAAIRKAPVADLAQFAFKDDGLMKRLEGMLKQYRENVRRLDDQFEDRVEKLRRGDELPPGAMKMVKVYVAVKRKLQPGDKMAGRHGNKGVVSKIAPAEDMPFMADGTPVDIVLNPLGVPSRMNVGQILETHLGWACKDMGRQIGELYERYRKDGEAAALRARISETYGDAAPALDGEALPRVAERLAGGVPIATPVFDGAKVDDISNLLEAGMLGESGQAVLYDGETGEPFERKVTVGYIYMLKLHHLVDEKIHSRSVGPYSLVTQQPLGGKSHFGGQRFGEMEVWALEAYGAAYTLQEMLTIKSDDVAGRTKVYEAIVKGEDEFEAGIPESFNVLVKEMRSLGLNVELNDSEFLERNRIADGTE